MTTIIIVAFIILLMVAVTQESKKNEADKKNRYERTFAPLKVDNYHIPNILPLSISAINDLCFSVGFSTTNKKLFFFNKDDKQYSFDFSSILQCELDIDGDTISKQSTSSTVGRAILGGLLTGGVGAIIGGTTGKRTSKDKIKSMDLKIIMDDAVTPVFRVNFFTGKTTKGSIIYKTEYAKIEKWHAIISGLIHTGISNEKVSVSVADELKKLKDLLDDGSLTITEYEKQKQKVLA